MRSGILTCVACGVALLPLPGCKGGTKDTAKKATEQLTQFAKEAGDGISEGLDEARKSTPGIDGATIVSTHEELLRHAEVSVHWVYDYGDNGVAVELAVQNHHTAPLRLIGLGRTGAVSLIDSEGFSAPTINPRGPDEFTVLPLAKQKITFHFPGKADKASTVVVYGQKYPVRAEAIRKGPPEGVPDPVEQL